MAVNMDIEGTVIADVQELLTAAGIANHQEGEHLADASNATGRVSVGAEIASSSLDRGSNRPAGFPRVTLTLKAETHKTKDPTRAILGALVAAIRGVIEVEEILADLTAAAGVATYYDFAIGNSFREDEGRHIGRVLTYSLVLRPSN